MSQKIEDIYQAQLNEYNNFKNELWNIITELHLDKDVIRNDTNLTGRLSLHDIPGKQLPEIHFSNYRKSDGKLSEKFNIFWVHFEQTEENWKKYLKMEYSPIK